MTNCTNYSIFQYFFEFWFYHLMIYLHLAALYVVYFNYLFLKLFKGHVLSVVPWFWKKMMDFRFSNLYFAFWNTICFNLLEESLPVSLSQSHLQWINRQIWLKIHAQTVRSLIKYQLTQKPLRRVTVGYDVCILRHHTQSNSIYYIAPQGNRRQIAVD